jgi:dephospho-CoA kinase
VTTRRPLRVALTGGIATGKSHCLARFTDLGAPTIDADVVARQAIAPGTPGFDAVIGRFGDSVLRRDGGLDREALGRLVFVDPAARRDLEAIVHPVVYNAIRDWFAKLSNAPSLVAAAIADIPLVYETGHEADFDRIVVTTCRLEQQIERLMERNGLSEEDARRRIDNQMSAAEKAARADFVIDTSGSPAETNLQVIEVWNELTKASP